MDDSHYSALIGKVLAVNALQNKIQGFASDEQTLNLVVPDWKSHLSNNSIYQKFLSNAKDLYSSAKLTSNRAFRLQFLNKNTLTVVFLGYCNVYKPFDKTSGKLQNFSITVKDTPVLNELNKAFHSDLSTDVTEISDTAKVNFSTCSAFCQCCSKVISEMAEKKIPLQFDCHNPCILDTFVYDGKKVVNRFASQLSQMLPGTFLGIVKVEFNLRYFYKQQQNAKKNCVRLGGNAIKLIAFPETNLKELNFNENLDLGDLSIISHFSYETPTTSADTSHEFDTTIPNEGLKRAFDDDEEDVVDVHPAKFQKKEEDYIVTEEPISFE